MSMIKCYAAKEAGGELEVYEYDPGELKPQDVEVQVDYCGICHSDHRQRMGIFTVSAGCRA